MVDFWAEWCGACSVLGPIIERLAREHPEIKVAKVDVDQEPRLAASYGVFSIPKLIRFDGGAEAIRVPGALPYEHLLEVLRIAPSTDSIAA